MEKAYLDYAGDGVYVTYDGHMLGLLANDHAKPTDIIYLEPEVFSAIIRIAKSWGMKFEV